MPDRYRRIFTYIQEHPWAILPETLSTLVELVSFRVSGGQLTDEEIQARLGAVPPRAPRPSSPAGIAVIPIFGIMGHRMGSMTEMSGGTSTERLQAAVKQAAADPNVGAIVLDIDSPGGNVFGLQELAQTIFDAKTQKPVLAIANAQAASGAFWAGSQASEFVVTPSGEVGSIGAIGIHKNLAGAAEKEGVKVTYIVSADSPFKTEGHPWGPLSDEDRRALQARVDAYGEAFIRDVARGRGVALKDVRANFGQGRMVGADQALALGMVDRVESFDAALSRLARKVARSGPKAELVAIAPEQAPAVVTPESATDLDLRRRRLRLAEAHLERFNP